MISPVFEDFSKKYTSLAFVKVDVDQLSELAAEYRVQAMPTFKLIIQQKEIEELKGADRNGLEQMIKNATRKVDALKTVQLSEEELMQKSVKDLKEMLIARGLSTAGLLEKKDLVLKLKNKI